MISGIKINQVGSIFIPGNVPSSKNSKQWTGRFLVHSKPTRDYLTTAEYHYASCAEAFRQLTEGMELPIHVQFTFIRDSQRKFDYINAAQIVQDLMAKHKWIKDDNYKFLVPYFNPEVVIDKERAGVKITILNKKHFQN